MFSPAGKSKIIKLALLMSALALVGILVAGCVPGLIPIGWSGGAVAENTLYVGSKQGRIVAVNISDQGRRFSEPIKAAAGGGFGCMPAPGAGCEAAAAGVAIYGTPVISGELLYVGAYNGKMYAYNIDSLVVRWVYPREDYLEPIVSGSVVGGNKVVFGTSDGIVYALDASTGDPAWTFETGDQIWATPAISGNTVYVCSFDETIYALDLQTGNQQWQYTAEGAVTASPLVEDGTLYTGTFNRTLYALNTSSGDEIWSFTGEKGFWATPVMVDDILYAANLSGNVYLLEASTGNTITSFTLDSPVSSTPVLVDNTLVVTTTEGTVYFINTTTREFREVAQIDGPVYGPLTAHEGIVYIHTQDMILHRINVETGAVMIEISLESRG